jgi:DNA-binding MarR family transcriptional regulator
MDNELAQALTRRLLAVQAALQTNLADQARQFGMTVTQAMVAQVLRQNPGSTLQEVSVRLGLPKSTVSRVVDDLVNKGIALRVIPASNRRTVLLSLADASAGCVPSNFDDVFPGGFPDDPHEVRRLMDSLDRLLEMIEKPSK